MTTILKQLKESIWAILIIIILLAIQASADLALPEYTANIVNIGIQNKGIDFKVPEIIREEEFNNLLLLTLEEKESLIDSYKKIAVTDSNIDLYPLLEEEVLYELKDDSYEIEDIIENSIILYEFISMNPENFANILGVEIQNGVSIFDVLKEVDEAKLNQILLEIRKQTDELPEMITEGASIKFISDEYETIGIDVSEIQSNYILDTGKIMILISFISLIATVLVSFLGSLTAARLGYKLRNLVFEKVMKLSSGEFKSFSTASLITRTTNDITQIQNLTVVMLRIFFYAPILGVGGILKVMDTNASMSWIVALGIGVIIVIIGVLIITVMPKFKLVQKLVDKSNLILREILNGISSVRAFSREKYEENRYDAVNSQLAKTNIFVNRIMSFLMPIMMFIMNSLVLLVVWNGAKEIDLGNLQIGDMLAFMQYAIQIIMAFLMISMVFILLPRAAVSANRIAEILNKEITLKDPITSQKFKKKSLGEIEFKKVSFKYPNAEDYVLEDISFKANKGETVAFIGSTGSGKSTLINLIPRFFDVTKGKIFVEGVDIKKVLQSDLRRKIGYVPQKGILFSGDIDSNVKYGDENISLENMKKSLEIAQATDFVDKKGFDKEVSQFGSNFSGGQKQRLSIARAIATNPNIFIFDDSFSALDFETDSKLRKALNKNTKDATILIVAQRVSTIMSADKIIVLDKGKVAGIGTHKELLKNCEVYKEIASSQLSKEEL